MGKKIGQEVIFRNGANYDYGIGKCDDAKLRGVRTDIIINVMQHGVKTKKNGYINNKRILKIK